MSIAEMVNELFAGIKAKSIITLLPTGCEIKVHWLHHKPFGSRCQTRGFGELHPIKRMFRSVDAHSTRQCSHVLHLNL